jgi:hypothetical protein
MGMSGGAKCGSVGLSAQQIILFTFTEINGLKKATNHIAVTQQPHHHKPMKKNSFFYQNLNIMSSNFVCICNENNPQVHTYH